MGKFIAGFMWAMNIVSLLLMFALLYPKPEHGYAPEHRAELQNKIDGLVPLSVADLGELE